MQNATGTMVVNVQAHGPMQPVPAALLADHSLRRVQAENKGATLKPTGCLSLCDAADEDTEHVYICACSCMQSKAARDMNVHDPMPQQLLAWM